MSQQTYDISDTIRLVASVYQSKTGDPTDDDNEFTPTGIAERDKQTGAVIARYNTPSAWDEQHLSERFGTWDELFSKFDNSISWPETSMAYHDSYRNA